MLPKATGTEVDPPGWTTFIKEKEIDGPKGRPSFLKRGQDAQDYLVLTTAEAEGLTRRIYIPLDADTDAPNATPRLTETLSGARPIMSALGNADFVYVADEETSTGTLVRTVRTEPHLLSSDDPTLDGIPERATRLNVPTGVIDQWKTP